MAPTLRSWLILAVALLGLSACYIPAYRNVEDAARYKYDFQAKKFLQPLNTWIEHPRMAAYVREVMRTWGIKTLIHRDDFDCTERKTVPPCIDCYICTQDRPQIADDTTAPSGLFGFAGRIFIRVEIGPGEAAHAMTYWRRGPEDR